MNEVFDYTKAKRFGVIRKLPKNERFRCNFKFLHDTREGAETEALRLTGLHKSKFYIVEIQRITSGTDTEENTVARENAEHTN